MSSTYYTLDPRRKIVMPGGEDLTLSFAADKWIETAIESIKDHNFFAVRFLEDRRLRKFSKDSLRWEIG